MCIILCMFYLYMSKILVVGSHEAFFLTGGTTWHALTIAFKTKNKKNNNILFLFILFKFEFILYFF